MIDPGHLLELLDALEGDAVRAGESVDPATVHLLFRSAHNLKGGLAILGEPGLAAEFHRVEDGLDRIRRGREPWSPVWVDRLLQSIDRCRTRFNGCEAAERAATPEQAAVAEAGDRTWGLPLDPFQTLAAQQAVAQGQGLYRLEKLVKAGLSEERFNQLPVFGELGDLGRVLAQDPAWAAYAAGPADQVLRILFTSDKPLEALTEVLFDPLLELHPPQARPADPPRPLRFLVVEEDPATGALLRHVLGQHGECCLCESGDQGLVRFQRALQEGRPFDLVALCLELPDIHGDQVLKNFRGMEQLHGCRGLDLRSRVVVFASSPDLEPLRACLAQEADGYLVKPVAIQSLLKKVALLEARRRAAA